MPSVLFITWDGPGPDYLSSLFLPIFERLSQKSSFDFHVLQFSWGSSERQDKLEKLTREKNISYRNIRIPQRWRICLLPIIMLFGAFVVWRYCRAKQINILMPRSIIAAGMALISMQFLKEIKLIYDSDGFMADERVDFGGWKNTDIRYKVLKKIEALAIRKAHVVLTRTNKATVLLTEAVPSDAIQSVCVVTNGVDEMRFTPKSHVEREEARKVLSIPTNAIVLIYCGSLGPQYYPSKMLDLFLQVQKLIPDTHLLVLANEPSKLRESISQIDSKNIRCFKAAPAEVPDYLQIADVGIAFRRQCFSQQAVAPIKVGEYLLSGLPVISSRGIGDLDTILSGEVGLMIDPDSDEDFLVAARWIHDFVLPNREVIRTNARRVGVENFGLEVAERSYINCFASASLGT